MPKHTKHSTPTLPENNKATSRRISAKTWWWIGGTGAALVVVSGALCAVAYFSVGTKIVKGVLVAGQSVGGKQSLDATHLLEERWATFQEKAFQFQGGGRTMDILFTADAASEDELVLGVVDFNPATSVEAALSFGRRGSLWQQLRERTSGLLGRRHEMGTVTIATEQISETVIDRFSDLEQPATNARLSFTGDVPTVVASANGTTFDYASAVRRVIGLSRTLTVEPIVLSTIVDQPEILSSQQLSSLAVRDVPALLQRAPFTLKYGEKSWSIDVQKVKTLLGFAGTTAAPRLGFDVDTTSAYLATIAPDVEVKAQNAKFSVVDGRVKEFQAGAVGKTLDVEATISAMQQTLIDQAQSTVTVVVQEDQPLTDTVATNNLGITELVAQATTNFKGSPSNRRFNLSYGAQLLNGLLIQPGTEFSLVTALGKIDGAHGWKPELVIKGSKITPEFGGGLCQVATTLFRTALNAGLPITERHNHSLRISYYEPPVGLDATIYEPKPDLRFSNDYTTPLLIQTQVDGNNLIFSFYGTKDGRVSDIPTPKVYNQVPIPATKNIEVDDLKPGEKECQAPGHPGADATATYTVTYADGRVNKQVFQSHYRAIGVICRVGKKAAPKPAATNTNTATTTNTNTQ